MKSTGIVRGMDDLGRIVLPKEIRNTLGIEPKEMLEIFVEGENIILRKYSPCCAFCGSAENTVEFNGKRICKSCIDSINKQV